MKKTISFMVGTTPTTSSAITPLKMPSQGGWLILLRTLLSRTRNLVPSCEDDTSRPDLIIRMTSLHPTRQCRHTPSSPTMPSWCDNHIYQLRGRWWRGSGDDHMRLDCR